MMNRRSRVIVYADRSETLLQFKQQSNRSIEMIAATDLATVEAALRVYSQVDTVIAEKSSERNTSIAALRLAELVHPAARRVLIVECDWMKGVYTAVREGAVAEVLFMPLCVQQMRELLGLEAKTNLDTPPAIQLHRPAIDPAVMIRSNR
jgi:hypothetical protein